MTEVREIYFRGLFILSKIILIILKANVLENVLFYR